MKRLLLLLSLCAFLQADSYDDIQKKAIVKLIKESAELKERIAVLEKKMSEYEFEKSKISVTALQSSKQEMQIKKERDKPLFFYVSKVTLSVREEPSVGAQYIHSVQKGDKVAIFALNCKSKESEYWGKSNRGWLYLSNKKYGYLINDNGNKVSGDYSHWCSNN